MYIIITNDSKVRVIGMAHAQADDTIFFMDGRQSKGGKYERIREGGKKKNFFLMKIDLAINDDCSLL